MPDEEGIGSEGYNLANYTSWASKVRFVADKDADPSTKFDVESLSIYSGGPIDKNFSYFFEYYMHERAGDAAGAGSRSKLADAYLFYNSDAAADTFYWVRAGQIYPYLIYYYGSGGRLSISRNEANNCRPGGGNDYTPRDRAYGVSAGYVYEGKLLGEVGIVNSAGGNANPNIAETNNFKDVYATLEYVLETAEPASGCTATAANLRPLAVPKTNSTAWACSATTLPRSTPSPQAHCRANMTCLHRVGCVPGSPNWVTTSPTPRWGGCAMTTSIATSLAILRTA